MVKKLIYKSKIRLFKAAIRARISTASHQDPSQDEARRFARLQADWADKKVPEYGYSPAQIARRAEARFRELNRLREAQAPLRGEVLEIGCGDGALCALLHEKGFRVTGSDLEDWRANRDGPYPFFTADLAEKLPVADDSYDFIYSYNTWEHIPDPGFVLRELQRVLRPGGHIYLSFGPLFNSPNGLHAYRMLNMPYPQFLFTEAFIEDKLTEIGIQDLGQSRTELQPMNRWSKAQFQQSWRGVPGLELIWERASQNLRGKDILLQHPGYFKTAGLPLDELLTQSLRVLLQKR